MPSNGTAGSVAFIDDLVSAVPEFESYMTDWREDESEDLLDSYRELPTMTLSEVVRWFKHLRSRADDASLSLIRRTCDCINSCVDKDYERDDMQNNVAVSLFWGLEYDDIEFLKPYLSKTVLDIGREYLAGVDGDGYKPF